MRLWIASFLFDTIPQRNVRSKALSGLFLLNLRKNLLDGVKLNSDCNAFCYLYCRSMTTSKRVQDRSKKKRVHDLEVALEKHKIVSKILFLFEILKQEPEQIMPIKSLDRYRRQINLPRPHKLSAFLRKSPQLFELYKDQRGLLWCGMTKMAEELLEEEGRLIEENSDKAAEYVTRMLMMSVDKRLPLEKIAHFRRDIGLPLDFRSHWVHRYPENFRVVVPFKPYNEGEYLELVEWKPSLAITELEKKSGMVEELIGADNVPSLLSMAFPMKFPLNYKKVLSRYYPQIGNFQKREYLSPYADARDLKAGSQEFDKRAVALMHELLSFTIEKRIVTDHLTHFRSEFVMPQKLMRLLLRHFGIFYVSERGRRFSVFLNEAYEGSELIEKHPLVVWKEKVQSLIDYGKEKMRTGTLEDLPDSDVKHLFKSDSDSILLDHEQEETTMGSLEDASPADSSEMEIEEIYVAYQE